MNRYDFRRHVRHATSLFFGRKPRLHRIPFGPNRGRKIYLSFDISARMYMGVDEPWVASLAHKYIKAGDVVYDLGAHAGYTTILFARYAGRNGSVHAFELVPSVAEQFLSRTVSANEFRNVTIHKVGLSDREQVLMLPVGDTMMGSLFEKNEGGGKPMEECRVVPLDAYIVKHNLPVPSLMKIDIECAEVQCLRGSVELIKKHSPILIIEFHSLELLKEGYAFLGPLGYTLTTEHGILDDDFLHTLHRFHSNVICLPSRLGTG